MPRRRAREQLVAAFNARSLHDDTVHAVRIFHSTSRRRSSRVEVDLTEYVTHRPRRLVLTGCANLSFVADFDVLTDNAFANTEAVFASMDEEHIREIMEAQMAHVNVDYFKEDDTPSDYHPTRRKLTDLSAFILFRITFFGGTLEVVARGFTLAHPRRNA
jgi:L-ascorbate metabolism protein UlaG (beta-lactamase superfamily)